MLLKKIGSIILAMMLQGTQMLLAADEGGLETGVNPGYQEKPDWFKLSFLDIREDINEAKQANKRVMLYFYQDGCPYCAKLLRDNFGQRDIAEKARNNFDVIAINMWGDREVTDLQGNTLTEKQFAANLKVMFTPTLLFLDEKGNVVLRINGYYAPDKFMAVLNYVSQHKETQISFRDYYNKLAPQPASGKLHPAAFLKKPPYNLKQLADSGKPLLLLFEQKQCKACDELHNDIYKRKETEEQLKRFDVVRLDMWADTPLVDTHGNSTTAAKLAKQLDVKYAPTMVFFNNQGDEVFRAEAYLKAFHMQSVMDYVASGAYKTQPNFQRFISARADKLEAQGVHIDLWK